ncbi:MAG: hypothetical protein INR62_10450 [Rhodospirillales bacterium]|nr:hypothetical protein [Acetobacter sp.]
MPAKSTASTKRKVLKDPEGGLTEAGRQHFKETEGANLKPGVKGPADTPEKMKRKGSFLRRHFANPNPGPMKDEKGKPTRRALSAKAWGEPVPSTDADVKKLAKKGTVLLDQYHQATDEKSAAKKTAAKKPAAKKTTATAKAPAKKPTAKKKQP